MSYRLKRGPATDANMCPYATSFQMGVGVMGHHGSSGRPGAGANNGLRCNTLGRMKTLEMTEYQKQKLLEEADTVRIKVGSNIKIHLLYICSLFSVPQGY